MSSQRYRLEFIVKAKDWPAVVDVFKDEFDIDSDKQDASYREIDGMFIVQVWMSSDRLSSDFYGKINESNNVALSYDPSSTQIRNSILDRVCIVEHSLRRLLLNISDIVEDYFRIYDKTNVAKVYGKNRDTIRKGDINPITSHLTLEDEINIFSIELSPWRNKPLSADELLELFNTPGGLDEIKHTLHQKTKSHTVWDDVDDHILKTGKKWADVLPVLNEIKDIRNKAAHFRVVTQSDLSRVKSLTLSLKDVIAPKRESTEQDLNELHHSINRGLSSLYEPGSAFAEAMKAVGNLQTERIRLITESALAAQRAALGNVNLNASLLGSVKASEGVAKRFSEGSSLSAITKMQAVTFSSLPKINFPIVNLPHSALDSIARAQDTLRGFDLPLRASNDTNIDDDHVMDNEKLRKDDEQPPGPLSDDAEGGEK